jgi:polysaccharide pyruvyl transferase WcaK-like protein
MIWRWTPTPYIVVGVGAGPTLGPSTRRRVRYICQGARQVCVRDAATRELLVEAGVSAGDMLITADLAIAIEREHIPAEALRHAQRFLGPRIEGRRRLCLHPPLMPEQREQSFELMRGLGARLRGQTQIQVFWLYDGGGVSLEEFQRTAAEALPESRVLQIEAPWKTTAVLGEMDAVLTTKLHVGIVAWALGVMPCSLSKHGKTVRFYQQIDRGAFQADYTTSPRAYEAWLDCLLNDPQRYYADDPQVRARVKAHAAKNFEQIDAFLEQISRTPS